MELRRKDPPKVETQTQDVWLVSTDPTDMHALQLFAHVYNYICMTAQQKLYLKSKLTQKSTTDEIGIPRCFVLTWCKIETRLLSVTTYQLIQDRFSPYLPTYSRQILFSPYPTNKEEDASVKV